MTTDSKGDGRASYLDVAKLMCAHCKAGLPMTTNGHYRLADNGTTKMLLFCNARAALAQKAIREHGGKVGRKA